MSDIELVVEVSEEVYAQIINENDIDTMLISYKDIIKNGILLPKGHGDLKDVGRCDRKLFYQQCGGADSLITAKSAFDMLMSLPTIIEADTESEK